MKTRDISQRIIKKSNITTEPQIMPVVVNHPTPLEIAILEILTSAGDQATLVLIKEKLKQTAINVHEVTIRRALHRLTVSGALYTVITERKPKQRGNRPLLFKRSTPLAGSSELKMTVQQHVAVLDKKASLLVLRNSLAKNGHALSVSELQILLSSLVRQGALYCYRAEPTGRKRGPGVVVYACG